MAGSTRWQRLRRQIDAQLKLIQSVDDCQLKSLPASSRYLLAPALRVMAGLYAVGSASRRFIYRHGLVSSSHLPAAVISIGNLTQGGTGKTPFVEFLARHFASHHRMPSMVLQCGGGTVDETVMLRQLLEGTPVPVHVQDSYSSVAEVRNYLRNFRDVKLVLMDDGLQHLPLVRDLEIVMVNSLSPFGNGHLLPRGTLREMPRAALRRADAVVLHHADLAGPERMLDVHRELSKLAPRHTMFFQTYMQPTSLRSLIPVTSSLDMSAAVSDVGQSVSLGRLQNAAAVCLVGVGVPTTVEMHLRSLGAAHVEGIGDFQDHHMFSWDEVKAAIRRVKELSKDPAYSHACLIMTEKDYARQHGLFDAVFSQYARGTSVAEDGASAEGMNWWGSWVPSGLASGQRTPAESAALPTPRPAPWAPASLLPKRSSSESSSATSSSGGGSGVAGSASFSSLSGDGSSSDSSSNSSDGSDSTTSEATMAARPAGGRWGAYVLQSGLAILEHDRRFSSANAVLGAILRMTLDKFRQRSYLVRS